jgi:hypothetical protein
MTNKEHNIFAYLINEMLLAGLPAPDFAKSVTIQRPVAKAIDEAGLTRFYRAYRFGVNVEFVANVPVGRENQYFWSQWVEWSVTFEGANPPKNPAGLHLVPFSMMIDHSYEYPLQRSGKGFIWMQDTPTFNPADLVPITPLVGKDGSWTFPPSATQSESVAGWIGAGVLSAGAQPANLIFNLALRQAVPGNAAEKAAIGYNNANATRTTMFVCQLRRRVAKPDIKNVVIGITQAVGIIATPSANARIPGALQLSGALNELSVPVGQYSYGFRITSRPFNVTLINPTWQSLNPP